MDGPQQCIHKKKIEIEDFLRTFALNLTFALLIIFLSGDPDLLKLTLR